MSANTLALVLTAAFFALLVLWVPFLHLLSDFASRYLHRGTEKLDAAALQEELVPRVESDGIN